MSVTTEEKKTDWLNRMHDACEEILACAYHAERLAAAFDMTGNTAMGGELNEFATRLTKSHDTVNHGIGEKISEQMHDSEQATYNMVAVVLATTMKKLPVTPRMKGASL